MSQAKEYTKEKTHALVYIYLQRVVRYVKIGILLHAMGIVGLFVFFSLGSLALEMLDQHQILLFALFGYLSIYGFTLPFFAEFDVYSRYQNYKAAKDLFYIYGMQKRIIKPFLQSRCQRDALAVAAKDLGFREELVKWYHEAGYRWYHVLPDYVFSRPGVFLTKKYWATTFFAKKYTLKYFLW